MAYKITDKCIGCGACAASCPVSCISQGDSKYVIDKEACIGCGTCAGVCPEHQNQKNNDKNYIKKRLHSEVVFLFLLFFSHFF